MATIGLYDIDLWHRGRAVPNLELMQYYNYYYTNNHKVIMMKPGEDEGRFNKIIYFKENPNIALPKTLNVYGENKEFTGYGFFKKVFPLPEKICNVPPSYLPYDIWTNKIDMPIADYEKMKRNSYIRLETNNFADYKEKSKVFFIADKNPFSLTNTFDFMNENKNKYFHFLYPPILNDEETANKFIRYRKLINKNFVINFRCSEDFFYDYYSEVIFKLDKFENETELDYQKRIVKMALWYKKNGTAFRFPYNVNYSDFTTRIITWARDNNIRVSYADHSKNSKRD